jgi:hypothetical protein
LYPFKLMDVVLNLTKLRIKTQKNGNVAIKYDHARAIKMYTLKYKKTIRFLHVS